MKKAPFAKANISLLLQIGKEELWALVCSDDSIESF